MTWTSWTSGVRHFVVSLVGWLVIRSSLPCAGGLAIPVLTVALLYKRTRRANNGWLLGWHFVRKGQAGTASKTGWQSRQDSRASKPGLPSAIASDLRECANDHTRVGPSRLQCRHDVGFCQASAEPRRTYYSGDTGHE